MFLSLPHAFFHSLAFLSRDLNDWMWLDDMEGCVGIREEEIDGCDSILEMMSFMT
jgi:hypothetical protein